MKKLRSRVRNLLAEAAEAATRNTKWVLQDLDDNEDSHLSALRTRLADAEGIIRDVRQSF